MYKITEVELRFIKETLMALKTGIASQNFDCLSCDIDKIVELLEENYNIK